MSVIVATTTVKTDAFAGLTLGNVSYSHVTLSWTNTSSSEATFRIVSDSFESESVDVSGNGNGTYIVKNLGSGTSHEFYLERFEIDEWIRQTSSTSGIDYVGVTTLATTMSISSGSSSAKVNWGNPGVSTSSEYILSYNGTSVNAVGNEKVVTGLEDGLEYTLTLSISEYDVTHLLDTITFTTSSNVAMVIESGPFASYVEIDWQDSVEGNSIDYRIVSRGSSDEVIVAQTEMTSATIRDLVPGTKYTFVLQRLELDGTWADQNELVITTLSSSISIGSIGSRTMMVSWAAAYDGAIYELFYNGTSAGQTTDTSVSLKNLEANTSYDLELSIIELGESVGLASLGMTTNDVFLNNSKLTMISMVILIIFGILMAKKLRK